MEQRRVRTVRDIGFLSGKQDWKGLTAGIEVRGRRRAGNETSGTGRYFISNKDIWAEAFGKDIRGQHWEIEKGLHWMLEVNIREEGYRERQDNFPENLNMLRKLAISLLRAVDGGNG
ncbi:MAG: ISAs1 family transposase [Treponema sp.]|nr:ISAs1 family transposase [Treponema sp.]